MSICYFQLFQSKFRLTTNIYNNILYIPQVYIKYTINLLIPLVMLPIVNYRTSRPRSCVRGKKLILIQFILYFYSNFLCKNKKFICLFNSWY